MRAVIRKVTTATTSRGSLIRKESVGGARYANTSAATTAATIDEIKAATRASSTITITQRRLAVARSTCSRRQTTIRATRTRMAIEDSATVCRTLLLAMCLKIFLGPTLLLLGDGSVSKTT